MDILIVQEANWEKSGIHDTHHIFERLSASGHKVRVIDFDNRWSLDDFDSSFSKRMVMQTPGRVNKNAQVKIIRPSFVRLPMLDYISMAMSHFFTINNEIKKQRPDVIIGLGMINANIAQFWAQRYGIIFGHYTIDELHTLIPEKWFQELGKIMLRRVLRKCSFSWSTNEDLKNYCIEMGAPEANHHLIKHGANLKMFTAGQSKLANPFQNDFKILFFMGYLYHFSGLVEIMNVVKEGNFNVLIVGDGEAMPRLQKIVTEKGLEDKVILTGWVPYVEVPEYLRLADICIMPSLKVDIMERIVPIKIIEYLAASKPTIANRTNGLMMEFGEDSGLFYIDRPDELIQKAQEILTNNDMEELGQKAYDSVKDRDWEKIVQGVESLLNIALESR